MKTLLSCFICLALCSDGFAQSNKIEGIWEEYKRGIVGDTDVDAYSINLSGLHLYHDYEFLSNAGFKDYGNTAHATFHFLDNGSYKLNGDTLKLYESNDDHSQKPEVFMISYPQAGELVLTAVCKANEFGYIHYFKKAKKASKSKYSKEYGHPKPAAFPGGLNGFINKNISDSLLIENAPHAEYDLDILLSIDENGKVTSATYVREDKHPLKIELKEAIRLVRMMPKWIAATDDRNKKVASKQLVSISFVR
jgi:hypothetical protein